MEMEKNHHDLHEIGHIYQNYYNKSNNMTAKEIKQKILVDLPVNLKYIVQSLNSYDKYLKNKAKIIAEEQADLINMVSVTDLCLIILSFIILSISFFIVNNILNSLELFEDGLFSFFRFLNREIDTTNKIVIDTEDEFGKLAKLTNKHIQQIMNEIKQDKEFIDNVNIVASKIKSGYLLNNQINSVAGNPALNMLKDTLNSMLLENSKINQDILNVLDKYGNDNYVASLSSSIDGDMKILIDKVNQLGVNISERLSKSADEAFLLKDNSDVLSDSVNKLTLSSNQQASNLKEVTYSLEKLTNSIQSNNKKSLDMAELANNVKNSALISNDLVLKTLKAMDDIDTSTVAIKNSVESIEQIAFQTNILSLNAAVEAATAGEAGKGFAVVAAEVRNLASRSDESAKQIKELVEEAQDKTIIGKDLSSNMNQQNNDLTEKINVTTKLIKEVTEATNKQTFDIEQIGNSVSEIDVSTQDNVNTANNTNKIAKELSTLSKDVLNNTMDKEFVGKNKFNI